MQGPTQTPKRRPKLGDGAHFLRSLVATPRLTGAVAPSGRALARAMAAAVVSSLPLLNQPPHRREKLIADAFALMGPEGVFVQFTYGPLSPIPREACAGRY